MNHHSEFVEKLKRKKWVVKLLRRKYPDFGCCGCCGLPWNTIEPHFINVTEDLAYFAFCEHCFKHKSFEELCWAVTRLWNYWTENNMRPPYSRIEMYAAFVKDWAESRRPYKLEDVQSYTEKLKQYSVNDLDKQEKK